MLWRTKNQTPEGEYDVRKMKVKVDARGTAKLSGTLTFPDLEKLPRHSYVTLLQCGAPKPRGIVKWTGVRFSDFAKMVGAQNFADGAVADGLCVLAVTERRRAEHGHAGFPREAEDFDHVLQRTGHRFVDVERLAGFDDRSGLFEMRPAIDALEHDGVHVPAQFLDAVVNLHAVCLAHFRRVDLDTRPTRFDVRTPAFERGGNPRARDVVRALRVVEQRGEGGHVRGVEADHANAQILGRV